MHWRRTLTVIALVVATSASPLIRDILEIPKYIYTCAFGSSAVSHLNFLSAYGYTVELFQCLSFKLVALLVLVGYCLNRLWKLLFSPLDYQRCLADTGYLKEHASARDTANEVRRRKKIGEIPPVYPNGWFIVLISADLAVKEVKYVNILGEHLAVFRGEDAVVYILDAYCPHLGANIAVGGQVKDNCLQCPFHGWRFQGDTGACVEIPYSKCVPEFAKTRSWHVLEKNQRIYVWYHAEGAEPEWIPEDIDEIENSTWSFCGQTVHYINAHIQELPENGADMNHLGVLHMPFVSCGQNLQNIFNSFWNMIMYHKWIASWEALEGDEKHCSMLTITQQAYVFGYHLRFLDMLVKAKQIGPGIVYMRWQSILGNGVFTHEVTPVEPLLQKLSQTVYTGFPIPRILAKILLYTESIQLERDIMVWNYKTYISKPLLVKEDHGIKRHRKWYQQFYSENSPKLTFTKNKNLTW